MSTRLCRVQHKSTNIGTKSTITDQVQNTDASGSTATIPVLMVAAEDAPALLQGGSLVTLESGVAAGTLLC
jgi:hypothetical protein